MSAPSAHIDRMIKPALVKAVLLVLALGSAPALAEDAPAAPSDLSKGLNLMEQGAMLLFQGLMAEMEPTLDEMNRAMADMEPRLRELLAMIDDIRNYQAPEMLENGDIIIRRKDPLPAAPETDL